jgi:hypothetical protein
MSVILRERLAVVYGIKEIFPPRKLNPRRPKNLWFEVDTKIRFDLERKDRACLWKLEIYRPAIVYRTINLGG